MKHMYLNGETMNMQPQNMYDGKIRTVEGFEWHGKNEAVNTR